MKMVLILKHREIREACGSLGHALAGEYPGDDIDAAKRAHAMLADVPRGGAVIAFSAMQMQMLWQALGNGAEGVLQPSSGFRADQKAAFREAANRIKQAGNIDGPEF
jgi:hypothetical protein